MHKNCNPIMHFVSVNLYLSCSFTSQKDYKTGHQESIANSKEYTDKKSYVSCFKTIVGIKSLYKMAWINGHLDVL